MPGDDHHQQQYDLQAIINDVYLTHEFNLWTSAKLRQNKFSHIIYVDRKEETHHTEAQHEILLDPNEFECLELNFISGLVLPNLYKSDKFIAKALENEGKVLIIASNHQKAIAIILGYLMYSFELSFW